jgi:hypothetical protein
LINLLTAARTTTNITKVYRGKKIIDKLKVVAQIGGADKWSQSKLLKMVSLANALMHKHRSYKELRIWGESGNTSKFAHSHWDYSTFRSLTDHEMWVLLRSVRKGVFPGKYVLI